MSSRMTRSKAHALCQSLPVSGSGSNTNERQTARSMPAKPGSEKASTATTTIDSSKPKRPKKVHKKLTEEEYYESRMATTNEYLHELLVVLGHTIVNGEVAPAHPNPRVNEAIRLYLGHGITSSQNSSNATTPSAPSD